MFNASFSDIGRYDVDEVASIMFTISIHSITIALKKASILMMLIPKRIELTLLKQSLLTCNNF